MSGHTQIEAEDGTGGRMQLRHTSTDSPILPAENLARLQQIDPALVEWTVKQTEIEANARRATIRRRDWMVFIERAGRVLGAVVVTLSAFAGSVYLAMHGQPWVAGALVTGTLAAIVGAILKHRPVPPPPPAPTPRPKNRRH